MPLLQVRDFPADIYEEIKLDAKRERRTIAQQTIVLIKKGLGDDEADIIEARKERRRLLLEKIRNRVIPEEVKAIDVVKLIHEEREKRTKRILDNVGINIENTLSEMLSKINQQNIHEEIETTGPVGKEIW